MSFDYRELMTQVLADRPVPDCEQCHTTGNVERCDLCDTTGKAPDCDQCHTTGDVDNCNLCDTTGNAPDCEGCSTTKQYAEESGSRYAQDLMSLRQQLRDALSAG